MYQFIRVLLLLLYFIYRKEVIIIKSIVFRNHMVIVHDHDNTTYSFPFLRSGFPLSNNEFISVARRLIQFQTVEHTNIKIIATTDVELLS